MRGCGIHLIVDVASVAVLPDAEVRISQDPVSKEISIVSCAVVTDSKTKKSTATTKTDINEADSHDEPDSQAEAAVGSQTEATEEEASGEFVSVGCATKWQGWFE
jgi:hypothetical protein